MHHCGYGVALLRRVQQPDGYGHRSCRLDLLLSVPNLNVEEPGVGRLCGEGALHGAAGRLASLCIGIGSLSIRSVSIRDRLRFLRRGMLLRSGPCFVDGRPAVFRIRFVLRSDLLHPQFRRVRDLGVLFILDNDLPHLPEVGEERLFDLRVRHADGKDFPVLQGDGQALFREKRF